MPTVRLLLIAAACLSSAVAATFGTVVTLLGGAADIALDEPRGRLYLVNTNSNRIEVYSLAQRRYLDPDGIRTDARPLAAAMSRDGKVLYVTCYDGSSLNIIDLDTLAVTRRVNLPARPEGVAVGGDGRVLITTIGSGTNNLQNILLIYNPEASLGSELSQVPVTLPAPGTPVPPASGRPALATRSAMLTSPDGRLIIGVNNAGNNQRIVFVYESISGTVLRARTVAEVSNVISIAPDGSKFMAGLNLFETDTLIVLARQNNANSPFAISNLAASQFNLQQNQGGSVFSPDGSILYSAFNVAPVQNPAARPNVSQLLLNDPDNLLIDLGLQLPENLAGKIVISSNGADAYALSESGFLILPLATITQSPLAIPERTAILLNNDQCGVMAAERSAVVSMANLGRGRFTATAQLLQLPSAATPGLGGGPGGGVIVIPPPGGTPPPGTTVPAPGANPAIAQTSPQAQAQNTATGTNFTFRFNTLNARALGTITPHNFLIQSPEAINIPPNIKIFQNNRDSEARGEIIPIEIGPDDVNEGLRDLVTDTARQRLYIANSGKNRIEVFDIRTRRFLPPVKVGQLPRSMALGTDGVTLYVANSGGEWLSLVDLDRLEQVGRVRFPPLPFNAGQAIIFPNLVASSQRGVQVLTSNLTLWRVVGEEMLPRPLNSAVFGAATTVPGPLPTMVSTPNGEYVLLLSGNGTAYLYDASVDEWVAGRQLFGPANQPSLQPMLGMYYGPISAGPGGRYFVINGIVTNQSLTPVVLPATGARPVAAVTAAGDNTYVRFAQPVLANANALPAEMPVVEVVNATTGAVMRSASALEAPMARVAGAASPPQRVIGRSISVDAGLTTAYILTTSGLSIIPLTPVATADRPQISAASVVNAGNYSTSIARGGLVSIFGRNLGRLETFSATPLPTALGGACVTLNNSPLPLLMTSEGQINVQIPPTLAAGRYPLVVRSLDRQQASVAAQITVSNYAPAVFIRQDGQAAIYRPDGRPVDREHPAKRDEPLVLYATGLGVTTGGAVTAGNPAPSDPLAVTQTVQVYFGDPTWSQAGIIVDWSGLAPGFIGLYQLNLRVPGDHIRGEALPVTLRIGGVTTPTRAPAMPVVAVD